MLKKHESENESWLRRLWRERWTRMTQVAISKECSSFCQRSRARAVALLAGLVRTNTLNLSPYWKGREFQQ